MKVVIVGGVAGGATAAARLRRLDENAQIKIFERSGYISYANCGLPYYIGGVIEDKDELTLQTPQSFNSRFNVDVFVRHEVIKIDRKNKKVVVKNLENAKEFEESYDKLILSTGAKPLMPKLTGQSNRVFTLRTVEDTFKIKEFIDQNSPKTAVICGGGFIGIEMAENLTELGIKVSVVQSATQLMNPFDGDMASFIHAEMRANGVELLLGSAVVGVDDNGDGSSVMLANGKTLLTDMVVMAIGVVPETQLAKDASLELGVKGAIKVDEKMTTSDPDVYAVGDSVEIKNYITGAESLISLAGPANKQARIVADNICGINSVYSGGLGSSVIKIFNLTCACTGINERRAKELDLDVDAVILSPLSHAGYYPDARVMTVKVVFEKNDYRLLGAQIVGYDGVDKRVDVIATAIRAGLKATELKELDLSYAPPYSSAKDPVNMAGFIIDNIANGIVKQWRYGDEVNFINDENVVILLDTRTVGEYNKGHIQGFINIPVDELRNRLNELDCSKRVYVICQSGLRSYIATRILCQNGFDCYNFAGGYRFYSAVKNDEKLIKSAYPCGKDK